MRKRETIINVQRKVGNISMSQKIVSKKGTPTHVLFSYLADQLGELVQTDSLELMS